MGFWKSIKSFLGVSDKYDPLPEPAKTNYVAYEHGLDENEPPIENEKPSPSFEELVARNRAESELVFSVDNPENKDVSIEPDIDEPMIEVIELPHHAVLRPVEVVQHIPAKPRKRAAKKIATKKTTKHRAK